MKLRVVKTNYTKPGLNLTLCRPPDWHGALRVATSDEIEAYEQSTSARGGREPGSAVSDRILDELTKGPASGTELADGRLHMNKAAVLEACKLLGEEGRIRRHGTKWALPNPTTGGATP